MVHYYYIYHMIIYDTLSCKVYSNDLQFRWSQYQTSSELKSDRLYPHPPIKLSSITSITHHHLSCAAIGTHVVKLYCGKLHKAATPPSGQRKRCCDQQNTSKSKLIQPAPWSCHSPMSVQCNASNSGKAKMFKLNKFCSNFISHFTKLMKQGPRNWVARSPMARRLSTTFAPDFAINSSFSLGILGR